MDHADANRFAPALSDLVRGQAGVVAGVEHLGTRDTIAERLEALGLVPGEPVRVVATGPFGAVYAAGYQTRLGAPHLWLTRLNP